MPLNHIYNHDYTTSPTAAYSDPPVDVKPFDWVTELTDNAAWNRAETARLDRLESTHQQLLQSMGRAHIQNSITHWAVVVMDDREETEMARRFIQRRRHFHAWHSASEAENAAIFRVNMAGRFRTWATRTRALQPEPVADGLAARAALRRMGARLAEVRAMRAAAEKARATNLLAGLPRALGRRAAVLAAGAAQTCRPCACTGSSAGSARRPRAWRSCAATRASATSGGACAGASARCGPRSRRSCGGGARGTRGGWRGAGSGPCSARGWRGGCWAGSRREPASGRR